MLIVGAKGFAKQLLDALEAGGETANLAFFDDVSETVEAPGGYPLLRDAAAAAARFAQHPDFCLGIGGPALREKLSAKMIALGGRLRSVVAPSALVGPHEQVLGEGCTVLAYAVLESYSRLGRGCLVNLRACVTHDCRIGDFCEIGPGALINGACQIGAGTLVGAGAILLPGLSVGAGARIGAGAIVTRDVPPGATVRGLPARLV